MRLSEKSIELNFCHQMSLVLGQPSWWFGTTQRQERQEGWDVAGNVAGKWVMFQLKASNEVLANGRRRFRGHHEQLVELQARALAPLSVFYVCPTIGSTGELVAANFDLLPNVRLLDVYTVPGIAQPTTPSGSLRKSELHYFDLNVGAGTVTIHSDPVEWAYCPSMVWAPTSGEAYGLQLISSLSPVGVSRRVGTSSAEAATESLCSCRIRRASRLLVAPNPAIVAPCLRIWARSRASIAVKRLWERSRWRQ